RGWCGCGSQKQIGIVVFGRLPNHEDQRKKESLGQGDAGSDRFTHTRGPKRLGRGPSREGLARTPERYEHAMRFLTSRYETSLEETVNGAIFSVKCDEMVIVKNIEFFSMCEHHLLPFFGMAHVAYLPKDKVIGLSKIPRVVDMFARRLQVQERMTQQI